MKESPWASIRKSNVTKMAVLSKLVYRLNVIPIKILGAVSQKMLLKYVYESKGPSVSK